MAIVAKAGASFEVCPAGSYSAVCCDIVDLGLVEITYSGRVRKQHKVRVIWQVDEKNSGGNRFQVSKRYTLSLHEKAALRKDLESWRGVPFSEEQLSGWDIEAVLNIPCMVSIVQNAANGNVYANVTAIMRLPKGMTALTVDPSYVRVQDRPTEDDAQTPHDGEWQASDNDVPF